MTILDSIADQLATDARELYLGTSGRIDELSEYPSAVEFLRYVTLSKPFVVRGGGLLPNSILWTREHLESKLGDSKVTISSTVDGWADAVKFDGDIGGMVFTLPHEKSISFRRASQLLHSQSTEIAPKQIYYLQAQDNCMQTEYHPLLQDLPQDAIKWAADAFGCGPEAVNFWMGTSHSVTSLHKDNYENIYHVVRGSKLFTIYPYTDALSFPQTIYPVYRYDQHMKLHKDSSVNSVPWYPQSPTSPAATPFKVRLNAGDCLFLPACWYHKVEQNETTPGDVVIAVNYWWDMLEQDHRICWINAASKLSSLTLDHKAKD